LQLVQDLREPLFAHLSLKSVFKTMTDAELRAHYGRQEVEAATSVGAARKQTERPPIVHTSLYLPEPVYEALRKIAFEERLKIHDVALEGIDLALRRRRYPSIESLKVGKKR
jgi:hypothetical protein